MGDFEKYFYTAVRFLSFRPRSEKETRDRLMQKKAPKKIIDKIISKLSAQKLLDDEKFAKWWIEQRTTFRHTSLRLIKLELGQKGISKEIIEEMIYDLRSKNYDLERAKDLIEKRIDRFRGMPKREAYQKLSSYLSRRGFDWETIKQSIDESLFE